MKILILPDENGVIQKAVELVSTAIRERPDLVLGVSPCPQIIGFYQELVNLFQKRAISFKNIRMFGTDEFLGLGPDNHFSNAFFLHTTFVCHVDVREENVFLLNGLAKNTAAECAAYEKKILDVGGIDFQLITMGMRGEVGRNEPSSSLGSKCRVKTLDPIEISRDGRFLNAEKPRFSLTMGVGTMMSAKEVVLIACGTGRAVNVSRFVEGPITSSVTASIFQRHPKCTAILDEPATIFLKRTDYYRQTS